MRGDGDGWVTCGLGHPHWGRHGAAGLLLRSADQPHRMVLMQLRVAWSHHGGTWGLLGGARDSHESAVDTALREAAEEADIDPGALDVVAAYVDDHDGWSYATVVAEAPTAFTVRPGNAETDELRWVPEPEVSALDLHPHFAVTWPTLRTVPGAPQVVVDAANVVGSRPDGWWRDRLGAARRLRDGLSRLAAHGLSAEQLASAGVSPGHPGNWFADVDMVVEGAASPLADEPVPGVRTVAAPRSGDDQIVTLVAEHAHQADRPTVVVTADRALRTRCTHADDRAVLVGPGWLHSVLDAL